MGGVVALRGRRLAGGAQRGAALVRLGSEPRRRVGRRRRRVGQRRVDDGGGRRVERGRISTYADMILFI